jgi:signal peptidase II
MAALMRNSWVWGPWSRLGLTVALVAIVIDQAHKIWMISVYGIASRGRVVVTPFLDLIYVLNTGISYSLLSLEGVRGQVALASFAVLAAVALTVWLARGVDSWLLAISTGLIIGGAIGNAIDRIRLGGVADFFSLHAFGFYWYVFNIADVAIVAGVAGLLYDSLIVSRSPATKVS